MEFEDASGMCLAGGDSPRLWPGAGFDVAPEFGAEGAGGFEAEERMEPGRPPRIAGRRVAGRGSENCEILVSATQIIEIRVITNQGGEEGEVPRGRRAQGPLVGKHSRQASAKYYRTREGMAVAGLGDGEQSLRLLRIAALAARVLGRWAGRVRAALQW
jgi:hypothetical protein